jgi:hypothetical protein
LRLSSISCGCPNCTEARDRRAPTPDPAGEDSNQRPNRPTEGAPPATPFEGDIARIYELLGPEFIQQYAPVGLEIGALPRDKRGAAILVYLICDYDAKHERLAREEFMQPLRSLIKRVLGVSAEQIQLPNFDYKLGTVWVTMHIVYGRPLL